jgi:dienelactone hydrolase
VEFILPKMSSGERVKLSACCASGEIATGTPTGSEAQFGRRPAYIARPAVPTTRAVIIATDIFGYALPNVRLIADSFAKAGFLTVIPDTFGRVHAPCKAFA